MSVSRISCAVTACVLLAGCASFFVGNSYQAQMPGFAHDLRHGDPGVAYSLLLGADALGALCAGFLLESRGGWTETSMLLHIFRGLFTRMVYRYLAAYAPTPVEALIGRRCAQDKTRHIAYSMQHLRYAVKNVRGTAGHINAGLTQAEFFAARDERDPVLWECLACIFGGGVKGMEEGFKVVHKLRRVLSEQRARLSGYAWADRDKTLVRIPIERAMQLIVRKGAQAYDPLAPAAPALSGQAPPTTSGAAPSSDQKREAKP